MTAEENSSIKSNHAAGGSGTGGSASGGNGGNGGEGGLGGNSKGGVIASAGVSVSGTGAAVNVGINTGGIGGNGGSGKNAEHHVLIYISGDLNGMVNTFACHQIGVPCSTGPWNSGSSLSIEKFWHATACNK